jgi:hypothetical protein
VLQGTPQLRKHPVLIILLILLFDHFQDLLGYCLATFSKQFEHLKQQNICLPL